MARVLVVDDDEQMRRLLCVALERDGYSVDLAANGRKAVQLTDQNTPDLVITDLIMPEQEGIETILQLKRKFPTIPIIAISGGGRIAPKDYLTLAQQLGANRTFAKPFRLQDIIDAVHQLTDVTQKLT